MFHIFGYGANFRDKMPRAENIYHLPIIVGWIHFVRFLEYFHSPASEHFLKQV